jgi:leucyl aminopeptidase
MLEIDFAAAILPVEGALVLLVAEDGEATGLHAAIDHATSGAVARALRAAEFTGRAGRHVTILAPGANLSRVIAVGIGKSPDARAIENAVGSAIPHIARDERAAIAADTLSAAHAAQAALGAGLRAWRFDRYRTREKSEDKPRLAHLTILTNEHEDAAAAWAGQRSVLRGVCFARELVSEPANILTPAEFADRCEAIAGHGLEVEILGRKEMEKLGFGALLGVAQGSDNKPRMVVMRWQGGGDEAPIAFVGKGVTFDSGGISIKPAGGMEDMKWDMAGAGAVAGVMHALAGRRARVNAVGLLGLVENMLSGDAQRPGDVVVSASGQTIEVINTDAEGRLVLADVIHYAQERFKPSAIIDLATLTGAIVVGLGHEYAGLYANDDRLADRLAAAGAAVGEKLWRMPLDDAYDRALDSQIADMKNIGGRPGGSITAAHFIKRFVGDVAWAHLDIAGTAWATKDAPTTPKGATAFGVRLLDRLVADHYEHAPQ